MAVNAFWWSSCHMNGTFLPIRSYRGAILSAVRWYVWWNICSSWAQGTSVSPPCPVGSELRRCSLFVQGLDVCQCPSTLSQRNWCGWLWCGTSCCWRPVLLSQLFPFYVLCVWAIVKGDVIYLQIEGYVMSLCWIRQPAQRSGKYHGGPWLVLIDERHPLYHIMVCNELQQAQIVVWCYTITSGYTMMLWYTMMWYITSLPMPPSCDKEWHLF